MMPSSKTEARSRGRLALDRDGASLEGVSSPERGRTSLEGASGPRARQNLTRGGDRPSSEAEPHPWGRPALERGEVVPVQRRTPRAERSSARRWLGRLPWWVVGPWVCFARVFMNLSGFSLVV
jgi:hypothetical protein